MSTLMADLRRSPRPELIREPLAKRIRAVLDGVDVVDTVQAQLVWEPRRILCEYAVPESAINGTLSPGAGAGPTPDGPIFPDVPFTTHSTPGTVLDLTVGDRVLRGAAFRPDDADLAGYVVLDFTGFDEWFHEDERNVGHPRDPYHRVETLPSSRHVVVELDGTVIAESDQQMVIYESSMPTRFYLPPDDVRVDLTPTDTKTWCAYKGEAGYVSVTVGDHTVDDVAWFYPDSLPDSARAQGYFCFDDSKVTVTVTPS